MKLIKIIVFILLAPVSGVIHAALGNHSVLDFAASPDSATIPVVGSGSWFAIQPDLFGTIGISSFDGLIVGTSQVSSGSHSGLPNGSESPTIDNPHNWFGNTGLLSTVSPTNIIAANGNTATLDFTGIRWNWNSVPNIVIYAPSLGDSGQANITCAVDCGNGDSYILDYSGHIQSADPSGLGGETVGIHLEGTITTVPLPGTIWLLVTGLISLAGVYRKKV